MGVIDVVPDATSRDEMGRAKVNDLLSFFRTRFGEVDTAAFQTARTAFIQSMAAYSILCYILQIKDRHNGNIMIDGSGHIVHIGQSSEVFPRTPLTLSTADFGFLFDIDKSQPSTLTWTFLLIAVPFPLRPGVSSKIERYPRKLMKDATGHKIRAKLVQAHS